MNEETTTKSIQTVDRAFQILESISEKGALSLNELRQIVGVNKASLHRLIYTLTEDGYHLVCIQNIGQKSPSFSIYTNVGRRSPLYATSAGKAILAAYTNAELLQKWNNFDVQKLIDNTITDVQDLLKDLANVRQRQYALDMEENGYNVFCIGSVVPGSHKQPIRAISLSGCSMTPEGEKKLATELLPATRLLSDLLELVSTNFI